MVIFRLGKKYSCILLDRCQIFMTLRKTRPALFDANIKVGTLVLSVCYTGKKKQRHQEQTSKKLKVCRLRQVLQPLAKALFIVRYIVDSQCTREVKKREQLVFIPFPFFPVLISLGEISKRAFSVMLSLFQNQFFFQLPGTERRAQI